MSNQKQTPSPWAVSEEMIDKAEFLPAINIVSKAYDELEVAAGMLQLKLSKIPRLDDVLDLFPETMRRLQHIKEDLEDIQDGKPFRHG